MRMTFHRHMLFAGTATLLAGTVFLSSLSARRIAEPLAIPLDVISPKILGWEKVADNALSPRVVERLNATSFLSRTYRRGPSDLDLFVAYYAQQRSGESMHSPKHCLPGSGWEIWKQDSADVRVNGRLIRINKYSIQNLATRMLMLYWYQSRNDVIASEYMGKVLLARDTLLTGRTAGSIVRITLPDTPHAADDGIAFAAEVIPQVQRCFGQPDMR